MTEENSVEIEGDEESTLSSPCSFCDQDALAVLTLISNGNVIEKFFCNQHIGSVKYGKFKFNVSREPVEEGEVVEEVDVDDLSVDGENAQFTIKEVDEEMSTEENEEDQKLDIKTQIENQNRQKESLIEKRVFLLSELKKEMEELVKKEDFKNAAKIRDEIKSIKG